jgi:hypothetical protein
MSEMEKKSKVGGFVAEVASALPATVAGTAGGAWNVASGHGGFTEGFDNAADAVMSSAREFGEDYGSAIAGGFLHGAAEAAGRRTVDRRHE